MDIEELSKKIDKYHSEDKKRAKKDRYERLGLISLGFAATATALVFANPNCIAQLITKLMAVGLFITGIVLIIQAAVYARKCKVK